jgi:hypothetical protein
MMVKQWNMQDLNGKTDGKWGGAVDNCSAVWMLWIEPW